MFSLEARIEFNRTFELFKSIPTQAHIGNVQLLVGDYGATGVTELVARYAKARMVNTMRLSPFSVSPFEDTSTIAKNIQDSVSGGNSIIVVDEMERASEDTKRFFKVLLQYPELRGYAPVVLAANTHNHLQREPLRVPNSTVTSVLSDIKPYVDAIHFVKRPQTPEYYEQIIMKIRPDSKNKDAVRKFAEATFDLQEAAGIGSAVRSLYQALKCRTYVRKRNAM